MFEKVTDKEKEDIFSQALGKSIKNSNKKR